MRIFKNKTFTRYAQKEGISDDELRAIVPQRKANQADANLGGAVYKMRVARSGEGKAGAYRIIVYFRSGERVFFVHGFAKSDLSNISDTQLLGFKVTAKYLLSLTDKELELVLKTGTFKEITEDNHEEVSK
ncbi:type II toxin-antitoxin system RelE/ParE family toxin [Breznakiellaceae bacterium SP9]